MSYFLKYLYKLFSNWSNLGHKSQVYFNHKQAVRAFHIDAHIYKPVGLAGGLFYRLNLFSGVLGRTVENALKIHKESATMDESM